MGLVCLCGEVEGDQGQLARARRFRKALVTRMHTVRARFCEEARFGVRLIHLAFNQVQVYITRS